MADLSSTTQASPFRGKIYVLAPALFGGAAFASAALVFLVEPMITRLVLPMLGGSPAVWNTCLFFFQAMLLAGYAYAHLLQRLSPRKQALVHAGLLAVSVLFLPLRVSELFGAPPAEHPIPWLLGVLAATLALPFFALSATAPLIQAWYARVRAGDGPQANPYVLYAASNLGSLLALLAYPSVVEPLLRLDTQRLAWSSGFVLFALALAAIGFAAREFPAIARPRAGALLRPAAPVLWRERAIWMALAAVPSSLMTGVTTYLSTDVASAPFLWVAPLALYLATFVIAFQTRPWIPPAPALLLQAAFLAACAFTIKMPLIYFPLQMALHLAGFFFAALICHQALAARRPDTERLTEFYLLMSCGGLLGGLFNALIAPVIFDAVTEYPLVLALTALARPWGESPLETRARAFLIFGALAGVAAIGFAHFGAFDLFGKPALAAVLIAAFMLRNRAPIFFALIALTLVATAFAASKKEVAIMSERSFFGVLRLLRDDSDLGPVTIMAHGTTMHGAQARAPAFQCMPLTYYARATPIGQAFLALQAEKPALRIGAIGMGAGAVAAYVRPTDRLRFFEIDPLVARTAEDTRRFTYVNGCAKGAVDTVLGDARLSLAREPAGAYDLLLVDAFSSDSVPAHLLTLEAIRLYLDRIAPGGVVVMHLSNRHLDLIRPVMATAQAAGAAARLQRFQRNGEPMVESVDAVVLARDPAALARFRPADGWGMLDVDPRHVWTDDHTNLFGALMRGSPDAL